MAVKVVMPKQGNSVESCVIDEWKKKEGDSVAVGDVLCEAETDKSTIEVESTAEGTILKLLYKEGEEVPVMLPIAIVGAPGEDISSMVGTTEAAPAKAEEAPVKVESPAVPVAAPMAQATAECGSTMASPRAKGLAEKSGLDLSTVIPTGPKGRIIERDVKAAMVGRESLTPVAKAAMNSEMEAPAYGSGIGGRVLLKDLKKRVAESGVSAVAELAFPGKTTEVPVKGIRKVTAKRMLESMQTTSQLTLHASADATAIKALRAKFKAAAPEIGVGKITVNDLVMWAVAYTLKHFPAMNAHFLGDKIVEFESIHLGMAVDTPKGLLVPVIRNADALSLRGISAEAKRLGGLCQEGKAQPDELTGSTFSVTNVGAFGVSAFTPVINIPEVAILGVAAIEPKPVRVGEKVEFIDMLGLSLTINHMAIDGAPGARFLKELCDNIANIDMLLAVEG